MVAPQHTRRTVRWAEALWEAAGVPRWDAAVASTWWRWAGHLARTSQRQPTCWACVVIGWRDAWWRKAVRVVLRTEAYAGRRRLNRIHGFLGAKRWDETTPKTLRGRERTTMVIDGPGPHAVVLPRGAMRGQRAAKKTPDRINTQQA